MIDLPEAPHVFCPAGLVEHLLSACELDASGPAIDAVQQEPQWLAPPGECHQLPALQHV